jgi:hypothetical protein
VPKTVKHRRKHPDPPRPGDAATVSTNAALPPDAGKTHLQFWILSGVIFALLILRHPESVTHPQFWAEDGSVFFRWQFLYGLKACLFQPYNGYLCVMQRLIAAFASWFPVYYIPLVYAICSSAIDSVCCSLFVLPFFRNILSSDRMRMAVCILMAIAPRANELIGTLVNAQWYILLGGTLLVFRAVPKQRDAPARTDATRKTAQAIGWGLLGLLFAFTMPVLIFCVPFCVWRIIRSFSPSRVYEVCLTAGLVLQLWLFFSSKQPPADGRADMLIAAVFVGFIYRAVMTTMAGFQLAMIPAASKLMSPPLLVLIATVVWLTTLWLKSDGQNRRKVESALYLAISSLLITLGGRNMFSVFADINNFKVIELERYFFMASCIFIFLMALTMEKLLRGRAVTLQIAALTSTVAIGVVSNFHIPPLKDLHWKRDAQLIQQRHDRHEIGPGHPRIVVPIVPDGWAIYLD